MIKVYASIASVGFLLISGASGCSSANSPDDGGSGTGNSTSGTTSNVSGSSNSAGGSSAGTSSSTAGTSPGTAGTPSGAGTGSGGASASCKGTKSGMACTVEGTDCPGLVCGIADSGTRSCKCETNWVCAPCDFTNSPFKDKPRDIGTCTIEQDKVECATEGAACEGAPGGEVCVCFRDDEQQLIWDCDKAPTTWAAPAM